MKVKVGKKSSLGVDLGHHGIKVVEVSATPSGWYVTHAATAPTPPDAIKDGVVVDPPAVGLVLKHLLKEHHIGHGDTHIAAAGASVFVRPVQFPKMNEATLRKTIRFEASRYLPGSVEDSHIDFAILDSTGEEEMNVLVVAAPKDIISSRVAAVEAAGLDVHGVDVEAFAMYRALLETDPERDDTASVAIIDIGGASTSVSVILQGVFSMNRSIPYGGNTLTDALKSYFKLSADDAESGKAQLDLNELITASEGPKENPPLRVIQPHLDDLVREVRRSLNYFQSQTGDTQSRKVDSIVLSGGGAKLTGLAEYLSHKLGLPVTARGINDNPLVQRLEGSEDQGLDFTIAGGLAMRGGVKAA